MALYRTDLIKVNKYSRPGYKLLGVKGIIMHYTANPSASAKNHVTYFGKTLIEQNEKLPANKRRYASAHFFVDKNEAVLIIPLNEVAYHANEKAPKLDKFKATASYYKGGNANLTTIGVELCIEKDGSLHPDTLKRAEQLVADLCKQFKLKETDIYRHYDVTGKNCPAFWVSNPSGFTKFKAVVKAKIAPVKTASKPVVKPVAPAEPKLLKVLASQLYTYKTANWNDKGVTVKAGDVFTVVDELTVSGSKMYKLKSGLYITANPKYVQVK